MKQSFPFGYLSVTVQSTDGNSHSVQLYSDISAGTSLNTCNMTYHLVTGWLGGNATSIVQWNTTQTASSIYHQAWLQSPQFMQEIANLAEDSTVYYGMQSVRPSSGPYTLSYRPLGLRRNMAIRARHCSQKSVCEQGTTHRSCRY